MSDISGDSKQSSDLIARMKLLPKHKGGVQHRDFEQLIKQGGNVSLEVLKEAVYFASDQLAFWHDEYLFSPIQSPNIFAKGEFEGWEALYRILSEGLIERVPEVRELLDQKHSATSIRHSIKRTIDYDKTRPLSRICKNVLCEISFGLDKLGFKNAAIRIYARGLYPKGTVGRSMGACRAASKYSRSDGA